MHGDGALGGFISEVCPLQGHEDQGAGVPALFGDHIEAGGTDVLDVARLGSGAGPIICSQAGGRYPRRLPGIGRPPAFQPVLGRLDVGHTRFDQLHFVRLFGIQVDLDFVGAGL